MQQFCGWKYRPEHIDEVVSCLAIPNFQTPEPSNDDVFNHLIFRQMVGDYPQPGPQQIGDCTSWGWAHLLDATQVLESYLQIQQETNETDPNKLTSLYQERFVFESTCTEAIYAAERIDIGNGRMGRSDGGVGAWCAKASTEIGSISRSGLTRIGIDGTYSGQRAKDWGRNGMPQAVKDACKPHTLADTTLVKSFKEAAWHLQNHRFVAVCSDVGFENGPRGVTQRDSDGFAKARGTWPHCMFFFSVRMGRRPGLLLLNQWPPGVTVGPMGPVEIPECSWWVDANTCDDMLSQGDSFTGSKYKGSYPARKLTWRF